MTKLTWLVLGEDHLALIELSDSVFAPSHREFFGEQLLAARMG